MAIVPVLMGKPSRHLVKPAETDGDRVQKLELEVAKQILAEVFSLRSSDVDDMIIRRLENRREPDLAVRSEADSQIADGRIKDRKSQLQWGTWPEMFQV